MLLSPSLLSADFLHLEQELLSLETAGISWLHLDVMDGRFVPNISFGQGIIRQMRKASPLFFDTHLMIEEPERYIQDFAKAGTDLLVVHVEACRHLDRTLHLIREHGMKAGVSLNPATPLESIYQVSYCLDLVLLMGVNPGFSGQKFIESSLDKVAQFSAYREAHSLEIALEFDGGVSLQTARELFMAGADVLVSGSAFFSSANYKACLADFQSLVADVELSELRKALRNKVLAWKRIS